MKQYKYPSPMRWASILKRPSFDFSEIVRRVQPILDRVQLQGDAAILDFTRQFDKAILDTLKVSADEISEAILQVDDGLKKAIQTAAANIKKFHAAQKTETLRLETMPGVHCWRKSVAIEKVGLYIPGGTAPLFSTILMLGIPAIEAGCKEIILCTPPSATGKIHPAILYTAELLGIKKIFKAGGAQAVAAMAFGTESIPKVFKIFGPGNQYVTIAKQLVSQQGVAIDMPAGPSEVAIVADESAHPAFIAADLLSQAEHGTDSQVVFVSTSEQLQNQVQVEIERQLALLPRKAIATIALQNSVSIVLKNQDEIITLINQYAPEHLILAVENDEALAEKIINAGSIFLGHYTPESVGDYASGTNHTLPTNGFATSYSGVSLDSFVKKITYQKLTKQGLINIGKTVEIMAEAEELFAHKNAVSIRLNSLPTDYQEDLNEFNLNKILRKNIKQLKPYASARDEFSSKGEYLFFDANENPFGSVGSEIAFNRYPDPYQSQLKALIAQEQKVKTHQIFLGNGSDEAIDLLFRAFCEPQKDKVLIMPPTYGMYAVSASINDVETVEIPLMPDFQPNVTQVIQTVQNDTSIKMLFLCSPNNPTGNLLYEENILSILNKASCLVVIDEAYIDFSPQHSMLPYLNDFPNLVVLQTFSKAWGLAGLRLGKAFGSKEIIDILNKIKPPYNVNEYTQNVAIQALQSIDTQRKYIQTILSEKSRLENAIARFDFVDTIFPSDANFILIKTKVAANDIYKMLLEHQIVVRNRSNVLLCENCLRITIGAAEENTALLSQL